MGATPAENICMILLVTEQGQLLMYHQDVDSQRPRQPKIKDHCPILLLSSVTQLRKSKPSIVPGDRQNESLLWCHWRRARLSLDERICFSINGAYV